MSLTDDLADRILAVRFADLPDQVVATAKVGILDTVGVTLAGAVEPCARIAAKVAGTGSGKALVFGTREGAAPADAAFINGTAAHALDFDDCMDAFGGHPSAPLVPALFALAEGRAVSGRDLIAAYVAGFETETRIARAVHFHHYDKGWHPTATLGSFGVAAACAHLLRLSTAQTATALAIAASFSSGLKANFGTMTKPLHVGHTARNGLTAALLAAEGFGANHGVFEHPHGFFMVFNGAGNFDPAAVLRDWGAPFEIVGNVLSIKQYPCCGSTHPAIDAMLELRAAHGLDAAAVEHVTSLTHARRLAHTDRADPRSPLDAKFSVQYCVARALAEGRVVLSHFEAGAYDEPDIRRLMQRVQATPYPGLTVADSQTFGAELRVLTKDGRMLTQRVDNPLGRSGEHVVGAAALEAKFRDCAARSLRPGAVDQTLGQLTWLEKLDDVATLRAALASGVA